MSKYLELIAKIEELKSEAEAVLKVDKSSAIEAILKIVQENELTSSDISPILQSCKDFKTEKIKPIAVYADKISGKTWSGRGLAPVWLKNKNKEDYRIKVGEKT